MRMITGVFPIVTYDDIRKEWRCLATGFFINPVGAFVTAKHLFLDGNVQTERTMYGVHSFGNEHHLRVVTNLYPDGKSDLMIGTLGKRVTKEGRISPEYSDFFALDFGQIEIGNDVSTYAYPNTQREVLNDDLESFEFTFNGVLYKGTVIDYFPNGSLVRNRCYQTNMNVDGGAIGGPVFRGNYVIGINSSSMSPTSEGEEYASFFTPIDFILDLTITENGKEIPIKQLIKDGHIKVKSNFA